MINDHVGNYEGRVPLVTAGAKLDEVLLALQHRLQTCCEGFLERQVPELSWATQWEELARQMKLVVETLQDCQMLLEEMAGEYLPRYPTYANFSL